MKKFSKVIFFTEVEHHEKEFFFKGVFVRVLVIEPGDLTKGGLAPRFWLHTL